MSFDLEPTDEQKALKETLHDFAESVLRPAARDAEAAKQTPDDIARQIHEIGVAARRSLEAELDARVHLDLQVRVRKHWRRDEDLLDRLGIE